ncbi:MAG: DNA/RNA non-specific endonuclease (plasmid) [Candidatus Algichlamydia australiensis]|nr:DNA/RNA non-specific endonuclease [Chlamydiales bacterium]
MYEVLGENSVAVPTHFFKVAIADEQHWIYVVPNHEINQKGSFEDFLISVDEFESISG